MDYARGKSESFTYDDLDRLTSTTVAGQATISTGFAPSGNIISKTDVGNYGYDGTKKHSVTSVTNGNNVIPVFTQNVTFSAYERPTSISENNFALNYTYGADYERIKGVMIQNGNAIYTRYFLGDFERNIQNGTTKDIHYISSPTGLVAIAVRENGNDSYNYTYTDHLGSILTIEKPDGNLVRQSFDAWGRRRDVNSWVPMAATAVTGLPDWLYRGYTGHEHLDQFGIINMNARLYDPVLGRMISPDNFVNGAFGTQGYNRYSYANNNPLKYIDPTGNDPITIAYLGALLIQGALFSGISTITIQGISSLIAGNFTLNPGALPNSFLQGALGAIFGFGIGGIFNGLSGLGNELLRGGAHALSGGVQSVIFGGDFVQGAISGLVGSVAGIAENSLGISNSFVGNFVIGGIASAITAQIMGGDPFQAFITGGSVAAFNDFLHRVSHGKGGGYSGGTRLLGTTNSNSHGASTEGVLGTMVPFALTAAAIDGPIPVGDIIGGIVLAGAAVYDASQRIFVTYTLTNTTSKQIYVGRTSGFGTPYSVMMQRYSSHHMRLLGFLNPRVDVAVQGIFGYPAIRGREQQLIDYYGGIGSPRVGNSIRGVAYYNPNGRFYFQQSNTTFGNIHSYTGF